MCTYISNKTYKVGRKRKISKKFKIRIKRCISSLQDAGEKINTRKTVEMCNVDASFRTVQRHMKAIQMKYKKASVIISLTKALKSKWVAAVTTWIENYHCWEKTIFSDEKSFTLDGPDDWGSYCPISENLYRTKRQCRGVSILLWPKGLLGYRVIQGNLNAEKYIDLLRTTAVPMMKLNYGDDFVFQ